MNAATHLDLEEMAGYLNDPHSADARKYSRHLARCRQCRSKLDTLAAMRGHLTAVSGEIRDADGTLERLLQTQSIERFVDGRLADAEESKVRQALADHPMALKAALHYASHSAAMASALDDDDVSPMAGGMAAPRAKDPKAAMITGLAVVKAWLRRRIPLWTTLPAAALATGLLVVALTISHQPRGSRVQIASFQDNPVVAFQAHSQAPGIGFFGTAARSSAPFGPVALAVTGEDTLQMSWPPIPQVDTYVVRLARRENGGTTSLAQQTTTARTATFKGLEIVNDHRYVWTLSGKTKDKKDFFAEGGFVFHQPDRSR